MKILLLGNTGQVGWELHRCLLPLGDITALDYPTIDMSDPDIIRQVVHQTKPNLIINATAYTNVDQAESEPELALAINGTGPGILAQEAKQLGAALIHYSTDYVFDGTKGEPYTEEDTPNPLNVYGATKLAGERAIQDVGGTYLIFRTAWVYSLRRPCFVTKVHGWARQYESLHIVDDQVSNPTWARSLAEVTAHVIAQGRSTPVDYLQEKTGLYHLASDGSCSRYEWAREIIRLDPNKEEQMVTKISPAKSQDFPNPAYRPLFSAITSTKFNHVYQLRINEWQHELKLSLLI